MTWALVTGASSGIGLAMMEELARRGWDVAGAARGAERLEAACADVAEASGRRTHAVAVDLASAEGAGELVRLLDAEGIQPDVVINNAGFGGYGVFAQQEPELLEQMLGLNVRALTELCREYGGRMVERGGGRLVNVASTAAFQPGPWQAVYHASKAYVLSLSEALAEELRGTGVSVTCVCPGYTSTEFQSTASFAPPPAYRRFIAPPAEVARFAIDAALAGRVVAIPGLANKAMAHSSRFAPRSLVRRLTGRMLDYEGTGSAARAAR
jgi:short-subunit dehydrogenase